MEDASTSNGAENRVYRDLGMDLEQGAENDAFQRIALPGAPPVEGMQEAQEGFQVCRVCQCVDLDKLGEAALKSLGICPPTYSKVKATRQVQSSNKGDDEIFTNYSQSSPNITISDGKNIFEEESLFKGSLIELGCACRSDLSLAHYACALRWFVGRDSLVCEICGATATTIRVADHEKVISTLKQRYMLPRSSTNGLSNAQSLSQSSAMPFSSAYGEAGLDSVSWFDPYGSLRNNRSESNIDIPEERWPSRSVSPAAKWAVEGTGILVATGLLTVMITWLLGPRVSKGAARKGLKFLVAGLCSLAIVIFLRFGVLPRIRDGSARYWAILVVFWFLIFGVWASSTRNTQANP